jgi:carboxypeptidase C (cathepsin A)
MKRWIVWALCIGIAGFGPSVIHAQEAVAGGASSGPEAADKPGGEKPVGESRDNDKEMPKPLAVVKADPKKPSISQGSVRVRESKSSGEIREIQYTASCGLVEMPDYDGKAKANIFFIAYTMQRPEGMSDAQRPITFAFNGGPGSSSVWLHMGSLGPKRIKMGPEGEALPPPYEVLDNAETWLGFTDLVFIDPVSTGYSRPAEGEDKSQFHGLTEDSQWVGDFIRLYTTREQRWDSPKFLCGESYGTTRAAALSGYLQDTHGLYINGIVMVSMVLNFQTLRPDEGNDLPHWLFLPSYTATAWHHKALAGELQARDLNDLMNEAEAWAVGPYATALAKGSRLPESERRLVAEQLARFTGLSVDYCELANLRIAQPRFCKELLRTKRRTVGRLDSRYQGIDADHLAAGMSDDPSYNAIQGPYTAAMNQYVRETLKYENDGVYEILTGRVHPWNYRQYTNSFVNVAPSLRDAMHGNRDLRVMVAAGYYDLATPPFASDYTLDHMGLDPTLAGNITRHYYRSGHMMYVRDEDRVGLHEHARAFYQATLEPRAAGR